MFLWKTGSTSYFGNKCKKKSYSILCMPVLGHCSVPLLSNFNLKGLSFPSCIIPHLIFGRRGWPTKLVLMLLHFGSWSKLMPFFLVNKFGRFSSFFFHFWNLSGTEYVLVFHGLSHLWCSTIKSCIETTFWEIIYQDTSNLLLDRKGFFVIYLSTFEGVK